MTCPIEQLTAAVKPGSSLKDLEGEWWQQRGYNKLFDCYPCQHIHENVLSDDADFCAITVAPSGPVQAPCWSYTYSYELFLLEGTKYF